MPPKKKKKYLVKGQWMTAKQIEARDKKLTSKKTPLPKRKIRKRPEVKKKQPVQKININETNAIGVKGHKRPPINKPDLKGPKKTPDDYDIFGGELEHAKNQNLQGVVDTLNGLNKNIGQYNNGKITDGLINYGSKAAEVGVASGAINDDPRKITGDSWAKQAGDWIKKNPWAIDAATEAIGTYFDQKAIKEQGRQQAGSLREQGAFALEKAQREAKDVGVKHEFEEAEDIEEYKQTHLFSGGQSYTQGSGTDSLLTANRNAARQLMDDIITEGEKQKKMYDDAAAATEEAAKKKSKYKVFEAIGTVGGGIAGSYLGSPTAGAGLGKTLGRAAAS